VAGGGKLCTETASLVTGRYVNQQRQFALVYFESQAIEFRYDYYELKMISKSITNCTEILTILRSEVAKYHLEEAFSYANFFSSFFWTINLVSTRCSSSH
jgi:hypothetical protein